ncbi:MAG: hypothetical protein CMJ18_10365 [Phycisphaeraceae bacterium]|nr:hypothetical protein [Phycisphaeraceae bacterium]
MLGYADTNTAGMMAVVAGLIFAFSMLAAPRHGVVSRLIRRVGLRLAVLREDVLGLLYRIEELEQDRRLAADERFIGGAVGAGMLCRVALRALVRRGRIRRDPQGYHLTEAGRLEGRDLVRSHRLWETYLHRHLGLAADHVHPTAEKLEHITDSTMRSRLSRGADEPTQDPQGRRIPPDA